MADPDFPLDLEEASALLVADQFTGRSAEQVDEFLATLPTEVLEVSGRAEELEV